MLVLQQRKQRQCLAKAPGSAESTESPKAVAEEKARLYGETASIKKWVEEGQVDPSEDEEVPESAFDHILRPFDP